MKRALIVLLIGFLLAITAERLTGVGPRLLFLEESGKRASANFPVALSPLASDRLVLETAPSGSYERSVIRIALEGRAKLRVEGEKKILLSPESDYCRVAETGYLSCRVPWKPTTSETTALTLDGVSTGTTIRDFSVQVFKSKRKSRLGMIDVNWILLLIFVPIPFILLLHKYYALSQWFIVAAGGLALLIIQPDFAVILFLFLSAMYWAGMAMQSRKDRVPGVSASLILTAVGFLILFKFGQPVLSRVFANLGGFDLALPLGLSYFVVRLVDTQLCWFRGELKDLTFREFLCFMVFPPTLAAGPIETARRFSEIRLERIALDDVLYGIYRICIGFGKKLFIADLLLAGVIDQNYFTVGLDPQGAPGSAIFLLLVTNVVFAYIDFSAYSDIAIGLGRLYGYRIRENFNLPILQANIRDYWQCWHMSLSEWAKRNVYMPVAILTRNAYVPIFLTMIVISLWHNPGLSWFTWALHHSVALCLITYLDKKRQGPLNKNWVIYGRPLRTGMTFLYVALSHSFILFDDYETALGVYVRAWSLLIGNW